MRSSYSDRSFSPGLIAHEKFRLVSKTGEPQDELALAHERVMRILDRKQADPAPLLLPPEDTAERPPAVLPLHQRAQSNPEKSTARLGDHDPIGGGGEGGGGDRARPSTGGQEPPSDHRRPAQLKTVRMPGMARPFPPFFVELYLHCRKAGELKGTPLDFIKANFPEWTEANGVLAANKFISQLEQLAVKEDASGGPTSAEQSRRISCVVLYGRLEPEEQKIRRTHSRPTTPSIPRSRATSPEPQTGIRGLPVASGRRVCSKVGSIHSRMQNCRCSF